MFVALLFIVLLFSHEVASDSFAVLWTVTLQGSSVHGIFQARVLEWGAIAFRRCWGT